GNGCKSRDPDDERRKAESVTHGPRSFPTQIWRGIRSILARPAERGSRPGKDRRLLLRKRLDLLDPFPRELRNGGVGILRELSQQDEVALAVEVGDLLDRVLANLAVSVRRELAQPLGPPRILRRRGLPGLERRSAD